eukprot:Phypoly_transcript_21298.p1 GENE.Phypoly_transcript_21298~~Phypoly_transcript_21298.p1  ORF type:complete len:120 (+),score=26.00 Phypoly_transcript_21298:238-597(+)
MRMEEEWAKKQEYLVEVHEKCTAILTHLREQEALKTTQKKSTLDEVHKTLKEKGEEKRKILDDRVQTLKQVAQKEEEVRDQLLAGIKTNQELLREGLELDRQMLGLFREFVQVKKAKLQ